MERGKFVLLGVLFLVCLGGIVGLYAFGSSRKPEAPKPPVEAPLPAPAAGVPQIEITAVPLFPEEQREEIEKSLAEKFAAFREIRDGVAAPEPEPYDFLLDAATLDARVLNLLPSGYDAEPPVEKVLADPGAWRGRLYRASGELLSLGKVPYEGNCKQVQEIRFGVLRDGKGRLVSFSWPVANAVEPDPVAPGKGWVRVHGISYKTWPVADPAAGGNPVPSIHLVLARRPQRDFPEVQYRDIDPGWMDGVRDATPADMLSFDEDPFFQLINLSRGLGPEGFVGWLKAKQAETPEAKLWPPEDMTGRYKELLERPDLWRFRPIQYTAFLAKPSEVPNLRPNPGNVEKLWIGILVGTDMVPAVWVCSPRSFVEQGIKGDDQVRVEGFFYKRHAYQPSMGGPLMQCAVVVAGRVVPVPISDRRVEQDVLLGIVGLMVLLAGSLAFVLFQGRRDARAAETRRVERLVKRRAAAGGAGPVGPASPVEPPASPGTDSPREPDNSPGSPPGTGTGP